MFNFPWFKKKEDKNVNIDVQDIQRKRELYQERKKKIDAWLNEYRFKQNNIAEKENEKIKKEIDKINSTCPKCGSTNSINIIKREKGELHGESNGYVSSSYSLFGGYNYGHHNGKIDGNLDTYPVNKCKDCGNEWNVEKFKGISENDDFSIYSSYKPSQLFDRINDYIDMEYDQNDIKEPYNSFEEKREGLIEYEHKKHIYDVYKNVPRYMLDYVIYIALEDAFNNDEYFDRFGYNKYLDKYSYVMPNYIWEIVKKIIGWKGEI